MKNIIINIIIITALVFTACKKTEYDFPTGTIKGKILPAGTRVTFPQQIYDVKAAIRWIRANGKKYHLNTDKIAVWGSSAGGHLAALAGTSGNVAKLEDLSMGNSDQSSQVQAVVDWFGPTDFLKMDEQLKESHIVNPASHSANTSPESLLLGKRITEAPEIVQIANPESYISSDDPPFLIQHGTKDNTVPFQQSKNLAEKFSSENNDKVVFDLLEGAGHGSEEFYTDENYKKVFDFLDKYLQTTINIKNE